MMDSDSGLVDAPVDEPVDDRGISGDNRDHPVDTLGMANIAGKRSGKALVR
ncbi:MAG: hypothetical protein QOH75_897, partial [Actinomycetota bacterium]|nr:hypothetical protein [Actinomycetota bacterium]